MIPQLPTSYLKDSFSYSSAVLWNSRPKELRQASSLRKFNAACRNTAEKRLRMRGAQKDGEEFKCQIVNKNMAI